MYSINRKHVNEPSKFIHAPDCFMHKSSNKLTTGVDGKYILEEEL